MNNILLLKKWGLLTMLFVLLAGGVAYGNNTTNLIAEGDAGLNLIDDRANLDYTYDDLQDNAITYSVLTGGGYGKGKKCKECVKWYWKWGKKKCKKWRRVECNPEPEKCKECVKYKWYWTWWGWKKKCVDYKTVPCEEECELGDVGTACDDGDSETVEDVVTENCECAGECPYIESDDDLTQEVCAGEFLWPTARTNAMGSFFTELEWVAFAEPQENPYLATDPYLFFSTIDVTANDTDLDGYLRMREEYAGQTLYVYLCLKPAPSNPEECYPFVEYIVDVLDCKAYNSPADNGTQSVGFTNGGQPVNGAKLYQNRPNPFQTSTLISFELPQAGTAQITLTDLNGRTLRTIDGDFTQGYNEVRIERGGLPAGIVLYKLQSGDTTLVGKMMVAR